MKKMAKVMVLVLAICLVVPSLCFAYTGWADATIVQVGQSSTPVVQLTAAGKFTNAWFVLDSSGVNSKSMLATALTAFSLGKTVHVNVVTGSPGGNCSTIYVNP